MNQESHLDRSKVEILLKELGRRCQDRGPIEMIVVGGAAMILAYSRDRVTRDIDAIFEPKMIVYSEVSAIANEHKIPSNWLNDAVKGLLPEITDQGEVTVYRWPGITVTVASAEYPFAMKASAARIATDSEDLLVLASHLGIDTADEALAILVKYYSPKHLMPKSSLLLRSLFSKTDIRTTKP